MGPEGGVAARGADGRRYPPYYHGGYYGGAVYVDDGWDDYYGPDSGAVAAGVAAGLAIGAAVGSLPPSATAVVLGGQDYYVANGVYYQTCMNGGDVGYCVVAAP